MKASRHQAQPAPVPGGHEAGLLVSCSSGAKIHGGLVETLMAAAIREDAFVSQLLGAFARNDSQRVAELRGLFAMVFFDGVKIVVFLPQYPCLRPLPAYDSGGSVDGEGEGIMKGGIRLENPFVIESPEEPEPPVPAGHKRCRVCQVIKPLEAFRMVITKKGTWPDCACRECSRRLLKEAYQRRGQRTASTNQEQQTSNDWNTMAYHIMKPRFPLGRTVATSGAIALGIDLTRYLHRHHCGDWGDHCQDDMQANEDALRQEERILSCYQLHDGQKIYIITERDRSSTCVMLSEDY